MPFVEAESFVVALDASLDLSWALHAERSTVLAIGLIRSDVVVSGHAKVMPVLGALTVPTSGGSVDLLLARIGVDGVPQWLRVYGDAVDDQYFRATGLPTGDILGAARVQTTLDVEGQSVQGPALAVLGFDGDGNPRFVGGYATTNVANIVQRVRGDAQGMWMALDLRSTLDLGTGALTPAGSSDFVLAHVAPDGTIGVAHRYGSPTQDTFVDLELGPFGMSSIAIESAGPIDLGSGVIPMGQTRPIVAHLFP